MTTRDHHGDGELLPAEALAQLRPQPCSHCTGGWMMPDAHDPAESVCANCGRSNFTLSAEVLADVGQGKPSCSEARIHGRNMAVEGRGREPGLLIGHLNLGRRRFL